MCWQIKPWLPSWSSLQVEDRTVGLEYGWAKNWMPCSPPQLEMAWCLAHHRVQAEPYYSWRVEEDHDGEAGICAMLVFQSPLTAPIAVSLFHSYTAQSASAATVNWGPTNRPRQEENDELGVCYTVPALAHKAGETGPITIQSQIRFL